MVTIDHTQLTRHREEQWLTLAGDASILLGAGRGLPMRGADPLIEVVGRLGHRVQYHPAEVCMSPDGESVLYWMLAPTAESVARVPACANTRVTIYNT